MTAPYHIARGYAGPPLAAYCACKAVTPSDTNLLNGNPAASYTGFIIPTAAIMCTAGGTVKVTFQSGDVQTLTLTAGVVYAFQVVQVWATGTTATGIFVLN